MKRGESLGAAPFPGAGRGARKENKLAIPGEKNYPKQQPTSKEPTEQTNGATRRSRGAGATGRGWAVPWGMRVLHQ